MALAACPRCKFFCLESARPDGGRDDSEQRARTLSFTHGGWCGQENDVGITSSTAKKVQTFIQSRPSVMHVDVLINKKDPQQVGFLLRQLLSLKVPVQVAFLQGTVPLQNDDLFTLLLEFLSACPVWSVNLGELRFSEVQCRRLSETLKTSGVTHMFYECTVAGTWKDIYRAIVRANRSKHGRWRFSPDCKQNQTVSAAVKSWFCPFSHGVNKQWAARNRTGWVGVDRVQCESCARWRRLPPNLDG